jgi:hypothetical protein
VNLRELLDHIADIHITRGGEVPVMSEEGADLTGVEYNDDEEPCVLLLFEEPASEYLTLADITKRESPE